LLLGNHLFCQNYSEEIQEFISHPRGNYAIQSVTLIDGTGEEPRTGQTILIEGEKIIRVGANLQIPEGYQPIDGSGKTLIPGLVMLHEHMFYTRPQFENWFDVAQMPFTFPRLYLAGGVTTMRTGGSVQPQSDLNTKKWIDEGRMTGPKMDVTSPHLTREGLSISSLGVIENSEQMGHAVEFWAEQGITSFKVYMMITREDLEVCVEEAHARGFKVTGHLCSVTYQEASDIGIDNLEHGFMASSDFEEDKTLDQCNYFEARKGLLAADLNSPKINAVIDRLIENGTAITTTPNVFEPYTGREVVPGGGFEALTSDYQRAVLERYNSRVNNDSSAAAMFHKNMQWLKRFYKKGGHLVAGTDPTGAGRTVAGFANQRTVEILVEEGFSLKDAIKICTLNGAKFLERDDQVGTIAPGKQADLVLINGDLTEDIHLIRQMEVVFKDGVGFDSQKMFESVKGKVGLY
jgi:imidazolonepropionase-like amidohydrolase